MRLRQWLTAILTIGVLSGILTTAAQETTNAFTGRHFATTAGARILIHDGQGGLMALDLPLMSIIDMTWNATGDKLAVIGGGIEGNFQLWVYEATTGNAYQIPIDSVEPFPPLFNNAGDLLFVAPPETLDFSGNTPYTVRLMTVTPQADAQPQQIASFEWQVGCGGGSPFPADARYSVEAGFGGNALMLAETPFGYLYSTTCAGVGYGLINPATGENLPIPGGTDLSRAALSPDGTTLYAFYLNTNDTSRARPVIARIDLSSLSMAVLTTTQTPDQLAVGSDGSVYYSTRIESGNLLEQFTPEQQTVLLTTLGFVDTAGMTLPRYTAQIYRLDAAAQTETLIFEGDAYAIGRMAELNANTLIFSTIANQGELFNAIANGTLDPLTPEGYTAAQALVPVILYQVGLNGGSAPTMLGEDLAQFSLVPLS